MKRYILTLLLGVVTWGQVAADTYESLWKQATAMQLKDLPKSEMAVMRRIIDKATLDKSYGNLLAAEMRSATLLTAISPDSLAPAISRMESQIAKTDNPVLQAVWYAALGKMSEDNPKQKKQYFAKALANPELLAAQSASSYVPVVEQGVDGASFGHDLLHVIGFAADNKETYSLLHGFYEKVHNRGAACLCAYKMTQVDRKEDVQEVRKSKYLQTIDSLIHVYQDIPEAGELAVEHYRFMEGATDASAADKMKYINYALNHWGGWSRMNELRNAQKSLTNPMFMMRRSLNVSRPGEKQWLVLDEVRNIQNMTLHISRLDITAANSYDLDDEATYKKLMRKTSELNQIEQTKRFYGHTDYEVLKDSFEIPGLRKGVYLVELTTDNTNIKPQRALLYVSDLALMAQQLPNNETRYVVVSATSGQPISGATIELALNEKDLYQNSNKKAKVTLTTDENGEAISQKNNYPYLHVYTADDAYLPVDWTRVNRSRYYEQKHTRTLYNTYTDRAIYRPGQTVHVTTIKYTNEGGIVTKAVAGSDVKLVMRDANHKIVAEKYGTTDAYGTLSVDVALPQGGLTGMYSVQAVGGGYCTFRVEEYKRPTFEVTFPKVNQAYTWGDTVVVKANAKTYAGVPVQGAKVMYRVVRRSAFWWYAYDPDQTVFDGHAVTGEDGTFDVEIPLMASEDGKRGDDEADFLRKARFFHFDVEATVTDQSGESHEGEMSLPIGTKPTAFGTNLPEQVEKDSLKQVTFTYCNNSGMDIVGAVRYRIDKGEWASAATNTPVDIRQYPCSWQSGVHHLEAICEKDTLQKEFVIFSLSDTRPAKNTNEWVYQSAKTFAADGKPVYVQVGSSANGVHIVYSLIAGNKVLEKGFWDIGDSIITRSFTYQPDYATGLVLNYGFVKEGKCYSGSVTIARPLPDKQLNVAWKTFRNRLTPGQKEEWTLCVTTPDGKPAKAQLMSVLYDKSLDQISSHLWSMSLGMFQSQPNSPWVSMLRDGCFYLMGANPLKYYTSNELDIDHFVDNFFDIDQPMYIRGYGPVKRKVAYMKAMELSNLENMEVATLSKSSDRMNSDIAVGTPAPEPAPMAAGRNDEGTGVSARESKALDNVVARENLSETAFFYPAMETDANGMVGLKFTLPESVTTWKFMGLAHDKDMRNGLLVGEAVAKKTVMVQPNMPRFLREGDKATIVTRVFNTSDKKVTGNVRMQLIDPETQKVVWQKVAPYNVAANATANISFDMPNLKEGIYINKVVAAGNGNSDGEQHYLPVLSGQEMITNTLPITLNEKGVKNLDLTQLFADKTGQQSKHAQDAKVTIEYTNNPSWMMIQALPSVSQPRSDNAISLMTAIYSNSIARHIMKSSPVIKQVVDLWKQEPTGNSLKSNLEKNQELKNLILDETPWVMEADKESEQKRQFVDYFDESMNSQRLSSQVAKLQTLQNADGSFSWFKGMMGSRYLTTSIVKNLVRLNHMVGVQKETAFMLTRALRYLDTEAANEVKLMKKAEAHSAEKASSGKVSSDKASSSEIRPSEAAIEYLYSYALDGRKPKESVAQNIRYLVENMAGKTCEFTIYGKAVAAVVLAKNGYRQQATDYLQSIDEYSVYKPEMGRYYDTHFAYYSWRDYKIPTQVAALEAMQLLASDKRKEEIKQMQLWLLQSKRTQAWSTPINTVNAVYAFMNGNGQAIEKTAEQATIKLDGKALAQPKASVGLGYVKLTHAGTAKTLTIDKKNEGTSWGAVYAQYMQPVSDVASQNSGIQVSRKIEHEGEPRVGDKVTVVLTITADRDYDFVQLVDKRAACLEPVQQKSGCQWGADCYVAPKDQATNYYFTRLSKGTHVLKTEYYLTRKGAYQSGVCAAQCAYSPEFGGRAEAYQLTIGQ